MALDFLKRIFNPNKVTIALEEIQALILRSRPVPYYGTVALLEIKNAEKAKQMLKHLIPLINSAKDWHKNEGASVFLTFTYNGLEKIGVPQDSLDSFPESFKEGMAKRSAYLYDIGVNDPKNWDKAFKNVNVHIAAAVIADSEAAWQEKLKEFRSKLESDSGIDVLISHDFGATEEVKNVFGFRDGISNPEVDGSGIEIPSGFDRPIKAGEFILGYPGEGDITKPYPKPDVLGKNGSFMIFRKYQSQVADFNKYVLENTNSPEEAELLASKMVGRWRSGAPLVLSPDKDDKALGDDAEKNNDFSFKNDEFGKKCPFSSHIRRMNPRDSKSFVLEDERLHRIIRRSVTFGDIVPPEVTKDDGKERGQYFMGISANAMGTLEFLQKQWANDGNSQNLGSEKDPMIGVQDKEGLFTMPADPLVKRYKGLQTFNIVKGGEYCFIPSISALKWISDL
ncbi:peroxidase [Chryseobacterium sp. CBo1]|uniref:Dyp-type peroxidase n=1 Tax=Chryseobacterium sp. CBo1 TaxID=1869230 RepID=UPI0008104F69|nr:Dyp-type peroxidase [Chryseobacterium sp. CBo1]OCK51285.1 peroxidase [Chryseobacterium sp. CBo1]